MESQSNQAAILETQAKALEQVEQVYTVQILNNADELGRFIESLAIGEKEKIQAHALIEGLVKSQVRRNAGRIRSIRSAIHHVQQQITPQGG